VDPRHRAGRLDPTVQGLLWSVAAGLCFVLLNTMTRYLTAQIPPLQSQFLRYLCGVIVLLPLLLRSGMAAWMPQNIRGQFVRGLVHTAGLGIWFTAIPHISLSDTTAMGFTTPIFIMLGAWLFLREPMHWERWLAAGIGFAGVLIVVGPNLSGQGGWWNLVMLSSAPMFMRSYVVADISATQSVKFLDLLWAALMGWLVFADVPTSHSLIGGVIIAGATLWIARREARRGT